MNNELKEFIEKELELKELSLSEKYSRVNDKIEELGNVTKELGIYRDELLKPIKAVEDNIRREFPQLSIYPAEFAGNGNCDISVPFTISGIMFYCILSFSVNKNNENEYQSGVYSYYRDREGEKKIFEFLKPLFNDIISKPENSENDENSEIWYGYKKTLNQGTALEHFRKLIKAVKAEEDKLDSQDK